MDIFPAETRSDPLTNIADALRLIEEEPVLRGRFKLELDRDGRWLGFIPHATLRWFLVSDPHPARATIGVWYQWVKEGRP